MSVYYTYLNHIWRLETQTLTYTRAGLQTSFRHIGDTKLEPTETSGLTRAFKVRWDGMGGYEEPTCGNNRICQHTFSIDIYYDSHVYTDHVLNQILTNDQSDIGKALDMSETWVGYNAANTSTDINILHRRISAMDHVDQDSIRILHIESECLVKESNY